MKLGPESILVIDDDRLTCRLLQKHLQYHGYQVSTTESCLLGLELLRAQQFDLIVVDLNMPQMDGFTFCATLKQDPTLKHIPVVMMTGDDDARTVDRAFEVGITDFIAKPINLNLLIYRVRFVMRSCKNFQQLLQSKSRLAKAQKLARLGNWEWTREQDLIWWSDGLFFLLRHEEREDVTPCAAFLEHFDPEQSRAVRDLLEACVAEQRPIAIETTVCDTLGGLHTVLLQGEPFAATHHQGDGVLGTMLDITQRREAEEASRASESKFRQLFTEYETILNGIPDSLTVWSSDLRLLWANKAAEKSFSRSGHYQYGSDCRDFCMGCLQPEAGCFAVACLSSTRTMERVVHDAQGRTWGVKVFSLKDEHGQVMRLIRLASDITERIRMQEDAARTAHLAALGEIAAGVAHEINNPTGLIMHGLEILGAAIADAEPILQAHAVTTGDFTLAGLPYATMQGDLGGMVVDMIEGAERIKRIVDELRDFSLSDDSEHFGSVDLNEVVRKAVGLVGGQLRKVTDHFVVNHAVALPAVRGSVQRLEQVVVNLLLNASQALASRDKKIVLELSYDNQRQVNRLCILDEGRGIPPELLAKITTPFFTTRRASGGTGLGLSVSSRIVAEHNGTLEFTPNPRGGTIVTVELPVANPEGAS